MRRDEPLILVDLLRFACALAVVGCHYGVGFWLAPSRRVAALLPPITYMTAAQSGLTFGWLGVELFFVISGMMIARSAMGVDARAFLQRRLLRLAPAAWVCGAITFVALAWSAGADRALVTSWLRSALFWPTGEQIDGSYWTLGIELAFYLLVAVVIGRRATARRIEAIAYGLGLASALFWLACTLGGPDAALLYARRSIQLAQLPYGCFFALGMLITRCQQDGPTPARLLAMAAILGVCAMEVAVHAMESGNETGLATPAGVAIGVFLAASVLLMSAPRCQAVLARRIAPATARNVGLATYPLYLIHQDAGAALAAALMHARLDPSLALMLTTAAALAVAWWVAAVAEPAVRRRLRSMPGLREPSRAPRPGSVQSAFLPTG